jgi:hypothetical protein
LAVRGGAPGRRVAPLNTVRTQSSTMGRYLGGSGGKRWWVCVCVGGGGSKEGTGAHTQEAISQPIKREGRQAKQAETAARKGERNRKRSFFFKI